MYKAPENCDCLTEIFSTRHGCVYQCDNQHRLFVEFSGIRTAFKVQGLFKLKRLVDSIDLDAMAQNPCRVADFEIVHLPGCERCFVLTLTDILKLRDLLSGAVVMLELNSILQERLNPVYAF